MTEAILSARNLTISFGTGQAKVDVVRGISLDIHRERLGLVGESGSGKSATARAFMRLEPRGASINGTRLSFLGHDLLSMCERDMARIRGRDMAMILQDPRYSLNPLMTIGAQVAETAQLHLGLGKHAAMKAAIEALDQCRIKKPQMVATQYPHEISGGMGQRAMIAMMLIARPRLVIADEPTSALDYETRNEIMKLLDEIVSRNGGALFIISHDIKLVSAFCDRLLVMHMGVLVEEISRGNTATSAYGKTLFEALPRLETLHRG